VVEWRQVAAARRLLETESGAIIRDWGGRVPVVLAYPNSYAVGMSNLAVHGLYGWLNDLPGVVCERAFAGLGRRASAREEPITLESQRPLQDAAVVAFSVSFESDYFNVVAMLQGAGIPLRAAEREKGDPLVVLGGPAVGANPEPLAPLADAIVIGEAEELLGDLIAPVREGWGQERRATLEALAQVPGVYVPLLHDGRPIPRRVLGDLDAYPLATRIYSPKAEFGDMGLIEISRGCGHGCRFCLAGYWYRPIRERSLEVVLDLAREALHCTQRRHGGKIGLVAAAVSDYSRIDELVAALRGMGAAISASSLRVSPLSPVLVRALAESGSRTITFAPEAGTERLRRAISKGISHDDIMSAVALAAGEGIEALKLYFMVGLPGETDDDVEGLVDLVREIRVALPRRIVASVTPFVPKAHTLFERRAMAGAELLRGRLARIAAGMAALRVQFRAEDVDAAHWQGVLARGDRRLGEALLDAPRPTPRGLAQSMEKRGLDPEAYLAERAPGEPLPWDFVGVGEPDCP
jgi:radical SAM superfamily enzyme YgiQ (UPF0313 family)